MNTKQKSLKGIFMALMMIFSLFGVMPQVEMEADAGGYNPSAAVSYAHKYALNYNPNYSNYNSIGGDCANFVSQCLHAGGLEMTSEWYWYSYSNRSGSWSACASMYTYFKNAGYTIIENPSNSQLKAGNPVLYYNSSKGRWSHAAICVGTNSSGTPLVSAHNNDHDSVDWKLGSGWSKRCTILISDGDTPDPNPPTNVTLSKNQVWYDIKDTIVLTPSADNATTYWMSITKDDVQVLNVQLNGSYSISANDLGYGDYHAWITAVNDTGGTDSNGVDFSIVGAATYTDVWTNKSNYALNETVSISVNNICAKGQVIGIDKIGYGRVITEECDSTYTISANQLGVGEYSAYFSVYNGSGGTDTKRVSFSIYDKAPTNVTLSKNQVWYDIKDTIILTPSADNATTYWMSITKDDVQVLNVQLNSSYSISANDLGYGNYHAWITAVNELGGTDSNGIDFSIVGEATYTDVWTQQPIYMLDETVSISINTICAKGQIINIDKIGSGRVITEECDSTYTISANQLGVGEYIAYFSVYNGSDSMDSKSVHFTVYNKNELPGDLNRDNTITISDTVIFQKYILGMQTLTQEQAKCADLTKDGIINIFDLSVLKYKLFS